MFLFPHLAQPLSEVSEAAGEIASEIAAEVSAAGEAVTEAASESSQKAGSLWAFFFSESNGLTTAGYVLFIALAAVLFLAGIWLSHKVTSRKQLSAKQLAFSAMALALGFAASYIKLFSLPYGGSVTLLSMLFITLIGYWYGLGTGLLVALTYGIMQFLQKPYVLSIPQICLDYIFAFGALGVSGVFHDKPDGLIKGYILAVICRGFFATLAGYIFWYTSTPDNFPAELAWLYPIAYNYSYLLIEMVISLVIIMLPPMKKALAQVKQMAVS